MYKIYRIYASTHSTGIFVNTGNINQIDTIMDESNDDSFAHDHSIDVYCIK